MLSVRRKAMVIAIVALGVLTTVSLRGRTQAGLDPAEHSLMGAIYAGAVPLFEGATFYDLIDGNHYDDLSGPITFTSRSWYFRVFAPAAEVAEFYRRNLPAGAKAGEAEPGEIAFEWSPPGARDGEKVTIRISDGSLQIGEIVKAHGANAPVRT